MEKIVSRILDVIARATDYPAGLLRLDADIEKDLCRDSRTREQLCDAIRREFGIEERDWKATPRCVGDLAAAVEQTLARRTSVDARTARDERLGEGMEREVVRGMS